MKLVIGVGAYLLIIISFVQNWLWLCIALVLFFSLRYPSELLIVMAWLIDGYFGNFQTWPWLTTLAIGWFVLVEYFKPLLLTRFSN